MPVLELQDANPEIDFQDLARCLFEAHESSPQNFLQILFPIHDSANGDDASHKVAREAAISNAGERLKNWHAHEPTSHWQKVVDVETGKLVGGASWNIFKTNPFADPFGHELEVTWFPDNAAARCFAERALENYGMPRYEVAQRPHMYLMNIFTYPEFRQQGVAQRILDWGVSKADELGLDIFLDATLPSKTLFEKNGFVEIKKNVISPQADDVDDVKWKEMEQKVGILTYLLMWRPFGGKYEEGKTTKPWEVE
ncbi:hypothetical protein BD289DRAFT_107833 [Coniella lustricola]|uniref:N-acetyltransferase domain-containing protein n=1 Tax=Coniella lustricola TaxID=2025994 RepID=A0A2T3AGL7_9PEZI|nr:hypothetical protein BD289DRAFT_107833 [Coniella lustricola]